MASPVILAIGGTGQHVALAASRLAFLGALPRMRLLTIDADDSGQLSKKLKSFGGTVNPDKPELAQHPLDDGERIFPPFDRGKLANPRFEDLLLDGSSKTWERETFSLLFDEAAAGISVNDGMFGQPSIGATIFGQNKDVQLKEVFTAIGNASYVIITGSFIGGTGAGIVHQLVHAIHTKYQTVKMYGIFVLPWISIAAATGATTRTVDDYGLKRNMQYGLHYFYKTTRPLLKASILLGASDQPGSAFGRVQVGNDDDGELETPLMLVAAAALRRLPEITVKQDNPHAVYASSAEDPKSLYGETFGDRTLAWYYSRGRYVQKILDFVRTPDFRKNLDASFGHLGFGGSGKNIGEGLYLAIEDYKKEKRGPNLDSIQQTWTQLAAQYDVSLTWLERVLGALPPGQVDNRLATLATGKAVTDEFQRSWKEPLPKVSQDRSPSDVAREFYQRLVADFEKRVG